MEGLYLVTHLVITVLNPMMAVNYHEINNSNKESLVIYPRNP